MTLLDVDKWQGTLESTDSLVPISVSMDGSGGITQFSLPPGWNIGLDGKEGQEVTDAVMGTNGVEYHLTKEAILEVCHSVGLTPKYVMRTPGPLIQSHLNYWATHSPDTDLRLLTKDKTALVVAKQGIVSFSNSELLDAVLDQLQETVWDGSTGTLKVDSRSFHSLDLTVTRLVLTEKAEKHGAKVWNYGVQLTNSLIGTKPLSVQGFMYNETEDCGAVSQFTEGRYNRKTMGQEFLDVQQWVREATKSVVEQLPSELETLDHAHEESIAGVVSPVLADIFKTYKVPLKARQPVMDMLIETEDFTYYGVVEAIAKSATYEGLPNHFVSNLMEIAGDIAKHSADRCDSCKRVWA